jgi:histidinol phosphatase-like enzyme (inositol monophosphatase family)
MQQYVDFARKLASASSEVILPYYQNHVTVEKKSDGSPVTPADREAEQVMRTLIMATFPAHGIIGEEFGTHQPDAEYQWVLDPIDGTVNFVAGSFLFGTLIALMHNGKPILGVIHHPVSRQLVIGTADGTTLNDRPIQVRLCESIEAATVCCSAHYEVARRRDFEAYQRLVSRSRTYRTWGDCHGYFLLATGGIDIMLDSSMSIWDIAALIPVVEGAGGKITDWTGGDPLSCNGIVATGGTIHDEVIQLLNA